MLPVFANVSDVSESPPATSLQVATPAAVAVT